MDMGLLVEKAARPAAPSDWAHEPTGAPSQDPVSVRRRSAMDTAASFGIFVSAFGGFMDLYLTQAIYPTLRERFQVSPAGAGTLVTVTTLGLALASPLMGMAVARLGARRMVLVGSSALVLLDAVLAVTTHWPALVAIRSAQGVAIPAVLSATLASAQGTSVSGRPGAGSVAYVTGTVIGGVVGRYLPAALLGEFGWLGTFSCVAALHSFALVAALRYFSPVPSQPAALVALDRANLLRAFGGSFQATVLAGCCLLFCQTATFSYVSVRLAAPPFTLDERVLGALYLVFLPSLIGLPFVPRWIGRFGSARVLGAVLVMSWFGLALTATRDLAAIGVGLTAFASAVFVGQAALAHRVGCATKHLGPAVAGVYLFFYYLGGSLGALLPGLTWSRLGWFGCLALIALFQAGSLAATKNRWRLPLEP